MADIKITHHKSSVKDEIENSLGLNNIRGKVTGYSTVEEVNTDNSNNSDNSPSNYDSPSESNISSFSEKIYEPELILDKEKIAKMYPGIGYSYRRFLARIARIMGNKSLESALLKEADSIKSKFFKNKASHYAMFGEHSLSGFIYEKLAKDYQNAADQYFIAGCIDYAVKICFDNKDIKEAVKHLKLAGRSKEAERLLEEV